ncbi:hypothetical protein HYPDE_39233 [Hyphomicrobium denitrificans 1NES1]|uniref:Uncharacterized protein n=1 Tax=Hyphomicrobium denitrificans 1NES1 TaxID=670307 RepID=N0BGI6_9HYPH|nr:hypothetical protein HYPDE_39233 [Hyphomicrobium denitrificans 1NES1]
MADSIVEVGDCNSEPLSRTLSAAGAMALVAAIVTASLRHEYHRLVRRLGRVCESAVPLDIGLLVLPHVGSLPFARARR